MTAFYTILILGLVIGTIPPYAIYRNNEVWRFRIKLLNQIHQCATIDIKNNRTWKWRYHMFDSVDYMAMFFQFWRPLYHFYKDPSFLNEEAAEPNERTTHS